MNPPFELPTTTFKINLPPLVNEHKTTKAYKKRKRNPDLTPEVCELIEEFQNLIDSACFTWDTAKLPSFTFNLPESQFDLEEKIQILDFKMPSNDDVCERKRLNAQQLKSIWQSGEFQVPSALAGINHVWRLNPWLMIGAKQRNQKLRQSFWNSMNFLTTLGKLFRFPEHVRYYEDLNELNFWLSLSSIGTALMSLLDLVVGIKQMKVGTNYLYELNDELERRRYLNLMKGDFPETKLLADFVQSYSQSSKALATMTPDEIKAGESKVRNNLSILSAIISVATFEWTKYKNETIDQAGDIEPDELDIVNKKIDSRKVEFLIEAANTSDQLPEKIKIALSNKLKAFVVVEKEMQIRDRKIQDHRRQLMKEIELDNPNTSVTYSHPDLESKLERIKERLTDEANSKIMQTLLEEGNKENAELYRQSLASEAFIQRKKDEISQEFQQGRSSPVINIFIQREHPWPVKVVPDPSKGISTYQLLYVTKHRVSSDTYFYRIKAMGWKYWIWLQDLMACSLKNAWDHQFGFKGLFFCKEYCRKFSIDSATGEIKNDVDPQKPVLVKFMDILTDISRRRKEFEEAPDNGFFGKKFGRLLSILDAYVWRLMILGILITLIGHTMVNLIFILVSLILFCGAPFFIGIIVCLELIIRVFVYDWDSVQHSPVSSMNQLIGHFWNKLVNPRVYGPIWIILIVELLINFYIMFLLILFIVGALLLAALFYLLVVPFAFIFRLLHDLFTYYFMIKCFGNVPQANSWLATRIAGPGISRNLYYSLSVDDAIILIQTLLEKIQLNLYQSEASKVIEFPKQKFDEYTNSLFNPLITKFEIPVSKNLDAVTKQLKSQLDSQIKKRISQLPEFKNQASFFNIKFSTEDLMKIKSICQHILEKNLKELRIHDFIWDHTKIPRGKYKLLTAKVLERAIGSSSIFLPVEECDMKISEQYEDDKTRQAKTKVVGKIMDSGIRLNMNEEHTKLTQNVADLYYIRTSMDTFKYAFTTKNFRKEGEKHLVIDVRL